MSDQPTKHLSGRTRAEKTLAAAQIRLDDLIPKKDAKAGGRIVFGANFAKTSTERTINMKEKSSGSRDAVSDRGLFSLLVGFRR